jgi:hypothetical protein
MMFRRELTAGEVMDYLLSIGAYDVAKAFVDFTRTQKNDMQVKTFDKKVEK